MKTSPVRMVYTLGYSGWPQAELLAVAARLDATVIDVRLVPRSRVPSYNTKALKAALGDRYAWLEGFGNVNYKNGGPVALKDAAGAVKCLGAMSPHRPQIILLCGCADVDICHRKVVAERLAELFHCPIEHLQRPGRKVADTRQPELF